MIVSSHELDSPSLGTRFQHSDRHRSTNLPHMRSGKMQGTEKRTTRATQRPCKGAQFISTDINETTVEGLGYAIPPLAQGSNERGEERGTEKGGDLMPTEVDMAFCSCN